MRKKNRHKIIIGIEVMILSITVSLLGPNAASTNPPSNGVSYNKNGQVTVENALDNLYSKANYGNATAGDILKGKKALVGGKEVIGTFTCPTLASLTPGDATPENIDEGKVAWVNGNKVVGTGTEVVANRVEIGDYISYTPIRTFYTVPKEETGYDNDQNITNLDGQNIWRVSKINSDGTIKLISHYVSSSELCFKGEVGWERYIATLDRIASSYENSTYTEGSGYPDYMAEACGRGKEEDCSVEFCAVGMSQLERNVCLPYFLATHFNETYGVTIGKHSVQVGFEKETLYYRSPNSSSATGVSSVCSYLRPIVVLKSTLKITGGNGTEDSPYNLGV